MTNESKEGAWYFTYQRRERRGDPFETVREAIVEADGRPITAFSDSNRLFALGHAANRVSNMNDCPEHRDHKIVWERDLHPDPQKKQSGFGRTA